ncbi:MAG: N-6 DNA methylase [Candidatus Omnitrophica bacterium]|nr:N-6 DNA methylase [Candidatus Omnitrophota bacterium]
MVSPATIKTVQDIMRKDTGVDGDAQRISQLVWLVFLKIFDDKEREYELMDQKYKSPLPEELRWRNWALDEEGITGEELLDFVNNKLFKMLKELNVNPKESPREYLIQSVFEDTYNYMKSGTLLRQVINKINQEFDFNKAEDRHIFNDLYESILKDLQSAGNAGEYYTPRPVTQFMVEMVNPKLGEKILDPACGTGGFLTCAIEHLKKQEKSIKDRTKWQDNIFGVEKKPLPHLLAITNMILHGIEIPNNIRRDNLLSSPLRNYTQKDRVDVIVTNPPFGGEEEVGIPNNFPSSFRTRETADLFLVLIVQLLKNQGRCALILPDGSLSGDGVKTRIKEKILNECNLHTIIRLPRGVFSPYTDIETNLIFLTKGEATKSIWFFEHPLPEERKGKVYTKTKPIRYSEFELEKRWWKNRKENEFAWKVSIKEIADNGFNLDLRNPNALQSKKQYSTHEIIEEVTEDLKESTRLLAEIEKTLLK